MNKFSGEGEVPRIILMGVSGSGKSLLGAELAHRLDLSFIEGDDLHPAENIDKLSQGIPLTDADRIPWLQAIHGRILEESKGCVVSCSALKPEYREILSEGLRRIQIVALTAPRSVREERLRQRRGHFFNPNLLDNQLKTLTLTPDITNVDASRAPHLVIRELLFIVNSWKG